MQVWAYRSLLQFGGGSSEEKDIADHANVQFLVRGRSEPWTEEKDERRIILYYNHLHAGREQSTLQDPLWSTSVKYTA